MLFTLWEFWYCGQFGNNVLSCLFNFTVSYFRIPEFVLFLYYFSYCFFKIIIWFKCNSFLSALKNSVIFVLKLICVFFYKINIKFLELREDQITNISICIVNTFSNRLEYFEMDHRKCNEWEEANRKIHEYIYCQSNWYHFGRTCVILLLPL